MNAAGDSGVVRAGEFIHSYPLEGIRQELRCDRCHFGGIAPPASCTGCHTEQVDFRRGTLAALQDFDYPPDPMAGTVQCQACHDLSAPTDLDTMNETCLECHDDEEDRFDGLVSQWKQEIELLLRNAEAGADDRVARIIAALRAAGPLHNYAGAQQILRALTTTTATTAPASGP